MCLGLRVITTLESGPLTKGRNTWNYMSSHKSGLFLKIALGLVAVQPAMVKSSNIYTQSPS